MAEKGILKMSVREIKRLKIIEDVIGKRMTQTRAGVMLGLSTRQVRRIVGSVRKQGDRGVIHRLRGRPSNRKIGEGIQHKVVRLYQKKYEGFGPTLACEKLLAVDRLGVSKETLRHWLIEAGLWQGRKSKVRHRSWRVRKECFGEMIQMDGSHHDWLEGRGPELVLMGYIDDATNEASGAFYDYEGTLPAMDSFKQYIKQYGLPISVYLDRHTTYKSTKKLPEGVEDQEQPLSQFERALKELGVEVIHAYSPQAKGRVERLFGVLQDRLVKEMRLAGIKTKEEANLFLKTYWPRHNQRFRVCAANAADAHVQLRGCNLDRYLCIKTDRVVAKDYTIAHQGKLFQIHTRFPLKRVVVEERCDGSLYIVNNNQFLKYTEITNRPLKFFKIYKQPSGCL